MRNGASRAVVAGAWGLFAAMVLQAALGILTLLNQVPIDLALAHQGVAIVVLTLAVLQMERFVDRGGSTWQRRSFAASTLIALAVAVDAAGVGQAPVIAFVRAAVVGALIVI